MKRQSILSAVLLAFAAVPALFAQDAKTKPAPPKPTDLGAAKAEAPAAKPVDTTVLLKQAPCYPLTTCVACGKPLPAAAVDYVKDGRLFRLDADSCRKAVDADTAAMRKKVDEGVIAQQKANYPLKTSPVSEKPLEANAVDHVYGTRLVRLASREEVAQFEKDPSAAMAKVDKAYIDAQLASYPLKACPMSKEELTPEAVNYLYGTKLVRFCCKNCLAKFERDPAKYGSLVP
jgi:YHS domain-containing protein